jgi:hypothetical protein
VNDITITPPLLNLAFHASTASGLLECGSCGGGFSKISKAHYGCSTVRNKATRSNMLTFRRDEP